MPNGREHAAHAVSTRATEIVERQAHPSELTIMSSTAQPQEVAKVMDAAATANALRAGSAPTAGPSYGAVKQRSFSYC